MSQARANTTMLPPRLSMDQYAHFIEASLRTCDRAKAERQKRLEERVRQAFCLAGGQTCREADRR